MNSLLRVFGRRTHGQNARGTAFTITELLVVITLIVILILIAVPSFQAMVNSSEEAMGQTQLASALRAARDAAIRSNGAGDGAAVFLFEPGGRTTIVPCVKVGEINDEPYDGPGATGTVTPGATIRREVFAAAPGAVPILLPKYWMVRGYAEPSSVSADRVYEWYGASATTPVSPVEKRWVFPETGFYDQDVVGDGYNRTTFMVRFRAGSGELVGATTQPALVLLPRRSLQGRTSQPFSQFRSDREGMEDPVKFTRRVLSLTSTGGSANAVTDKQRLMGRRSSDMVLARPVMQLALYNERRLAAAFGARLDPETQSIYQGPTAQGITGGTTGYHATYVTGGRTPFTLHNIGEYMRGDTDLDGAARDNTSKDRPEAHLFNINRYTGAIREMEVQP